MSLPVVTTPIADARIRTIDHWWRANRPAAPNLFATELVAALQLLASAPRAGVPYRHPSITGIRRLFLTRSRYHVYYAIADVAVMVLTVRHASRGTGPQFSGGD